MLKDCAMPSACSGSPEAGPPVVVLSLALGIGANTAFSAR